MASTIDRDVKSLTINNCAREKKKGRIHKLKKEERLQYSKEDKLSHKGIKREKKYRKMEL